MNNKIIYITLLSVLILVLLISLICLVYEINKNCTSKENLKYHTKFIKNKKSLKKRKTTKNKISRLSESEPPFTIVDPIKFKELLYKNQIIPKKEYEMKNLPDETEDKIVQSKIQELNEKYKTKDNEDEFVNLMSVLPYFSFYLWDNITESLFSDERIEEAISVLLELLKPKCRVMNGRQAVAVIFVESKSPNGPRFEDGEIDELKRQISKGLRYLEKRHPNNNLTWISEFHEVKIGTQNRTIPHNVRMSYAFDKYWIDPATEELNCKLSSRVVQVRGENREVCNRSLNLSGIKYRLKRVNNCNYSNLIWVTPYNTSWGAYAYYNAEQIIIGKNYFGPTSFFGLIGGDDYLGHGLENTWYIFAHELCHLYGAPDEYSGGCNCGIRENSCNKTLNGNCEDCVDEQTSEENCLMRAGQNQEEDEVILCPYSQSSIGWINDYIKVNISTADELFAGTNEDVRITFYNQFNEPIEFKLDTPGYDDFEAGDSDWYIFPLSVNMFGNLALENVDLTRFKISLEPSFFTDNFKIQTIRIYRNEELEYSSSPNVWLNSDNLVWSSF